MTALQEVRETLSVDILTESIYEKRRGWENTLTKSFNATKSVNVKMKNQKSCILFYFLSYSNFVKYWLFAAIQIYTSFNQYLMSWDWDFSNQ